MSSLKSVTDAIASVAERSFFAYAEPVTSAVPMPGECYEICVAFTGAFTGVVRIVMPIGLAFDLCTAFAGVDPGDGMEQSSVADLAGEFGNMACGTWLTSLGEAVCFSLTHPVVNACADAESRPAVMLINDQPISVTLELES
jgi:CheY-specific phosphatase CheX